MFHLLNSVIFFITIPPYILCAINATWNENRFDVGYRYKDIFEYNLTSPSEVDMFVNEWIRRTLEENPRRYPRHINNSSSFTEVTKKVYFKNKWSVRKYCFNISLDTTCIEVFAPKPPLTKESPIWFRYSTTPGSYSEMKDLDNKESYKGHSTGKHKKKYDKDDKQFKNLHVFDQFYKNLGKRKKKLSKNLKNNRSNKKFIEQHYFGVRSKALEEHVFENPESVLTYGTNTFAEMNKKTSITPILKSFESRPILEIAEHGVQIESLEKEIDEKDNKKEDLMKPERKEEEDDENEIKERIKRSHSNKNNQGSDDDGNDDGDDDDDDDDEDGEHDYKDHFAGKEEYLGEKWKDEGFPLADHDYLVFREGDHGGNGNQDDSSAGDTTEPDEASDAHHLTGKPQKLNLGHHNSELSETDDSDASDTDDTDTSDTDDTDDADASDTDDADESDTDDSDSSDTDDADSSDMDDADSSDMDDADSSDMDDSGEKHLHEMGNGGNSKNWNKCVLPTPRKTSEVLCKALPSKKICKLYCIHGHTFPEGITRETTCDLNRGFWSKKFDECLPFVDCTLKLRTAGYLKCTTNTVQTGPMCQIECQRYGNNLACERAKHQCDTTGRWNPPLPHCVQREGIDLVHPPPHTYHHARDYPH